MLKKSLIFILTIAICLTIVVAPASAATGRHEVLMKGDKDEWVSELQKELYAKGYLKQNPTGYFGINTQNAVIQFQKDNKIAVDGKAGPVTRKALLGNKYKDIGQERLTGGTKVDAEVFYPGDRGDDIKTIQQLLKEQDYYKYSSITGYFGPITVDAVKRFQSVNGIKVDGIVGKETMKLLKSGGAKSFVIYPGDRGDEVTKIQNRLKELKYFTGNATGYFGAVTEAAVKEFQKANKLTVDGKVGKNTSAVLYSSSAKAKTASSATQTSNDKKEDTKNSTTTTQTKVETMIEFAKAQLGKPYKYATQGPSSFDCSGLVYYVLREMRVSTSRLSSIGFSNVGNWSKITKMNSLQPGDLVFFKGDGGSVINHVGIYIGSNKMIHASSSQKQIVISNINTDYYNRNFVCARRVF